MPRNVTTRLELDNIALTFSADVAPTDYGVRGNPGTIEVENIRIEGVEIFGVPVDDRILPPALRKAILAYADEADFLEAM